jgi:integrase
MLPDLTEERIRKYMQARKTEGAGGRTINMEVSMPARAIGKKWSILWSKVKRNEEPTDTGRALSPEEEARLLKELEEARSPVLATFVKALLLTCIRCGELTGMRWAQVDFAQRVMTVGKAKTDAGTGRLRLKPKVQPTPQGFPQSQENAPGFASVKTVLTH